ncbi:hypothetical protein MLD38_015652 [Melastoma candidum]|uniref:Uncharacterized protein n=1 Tax=Melastoma candidum TaxID=119954 RepID=A0ACB9RKH0_9MYRT|nr:hypothetical protein MLD38_015652 [Melastoma candidum]
MARIPSLRPEIGPDGLPREAPVIAYTEKIIEEEQLQLRKYIQENYSKIRDVEKELAGLSMEMKLTAGPKKAALELLRKKIEASTEKVRIAKQKEEQARKVWEAASQTLKEEEQLKQKLCDDLTNLVQESSNSQFARLEELKRRLAALNPSRASPVSTHDGILMEPVKDGAAAVNAASVLLEPVGGGESKPNGGGILVKGGPPGEGEEKVRKKVHFLGKGKNPGVSKGRGSSGPGWTGAGFDVDGRS